jgi:hypothetical protein
MPPVLELPVRMIRDLAMLWAVVGTAGLMMWIRAAGSYLEILARMS